MYHEREDALPATVSAFDAALDAAMGELAVLENAVRCSVTVNDERERRAHAHTSGAKRAARLRAELGDTRAATQLWEQRAAGLATSTARLRALLAADAGPPSQTRGRRFAPVLAPTTRQAVRAQSSDAAAARAALVSLHTKQDENDDAAAEERARFDVLRERVVALRKQMSSLVAQRKRTADSEALMVDRSQAAGRRLAGPRGRLKLLSPVREMYRRLSKAERTRAATLRALAGHHRRHRLSENGSARVLQKTYRAFAASRGRERADERMLAEEQVLMETCMRRVKAAQSEHIRLAGAIGSLRHTLDAAEGERSASAATLKHLEVRAASLEAERVALAERSARLDAKAEQARQDARRELPNHMPSTARDAGVALGASL